MRCKLHDPILALIGTCVWIAVPWGLRAQEPWAAESQPPTIWESVRDGDVDSLNLRLEQGDDVNAQDDLWGMTPLSMAAMAGQREACNVLLQRGAKVGAPNRDGSTPLHTAVFFGRAEIVQLLLDRGASPNARGGSGETPLDTAQSTWEVTQAVASLVGQDLPREAWERGREEASEMLVARGGQREEGGIVIVLIVLAAIFGMLLLIHLVISGTSCFILISALEALPPEHREVSRGKVLLLLLPVFNVLWNFIVFPAVSRSYASYFVSTERDRTEAGKDLALGYCICSAGIFLPVVNALCGVVSLVLLGIYLTKINGYKHEVRRLRESWG